MWIFQRFCLYTLLGTTHKNHISFSWGHLHVYFGLGLGDEDCGDHYQKWLHRALSRMPPTSAAPSPLTIRLPLLLSVNTWNRLNCCNSLWIQVIPSLSASVVAVSSVGIPAIQDLLLILKTVVTGLLRCLFSISWRI